MQSLNLKAIVLILAALVIVLLLPAEQPSASKNDPSQPSKPPSPQIEAKSALAQDFLTGEILFSKNSDAILPLASITKIITILAVLDKLDLDEEVEISSKAVLTTEPSSLRVGEHIKVRDLITMAIVESSNDATYALFERAYKKSGLPDFAEAWFLDLMRQKAAALGAPNTVFNNFIGLDVSETLSGAYGSAADLLKITQASLDSPIWQFGTVREIISKERIRHALKPTNQLDSDLNLLVGAKTGFTDLAGGNLLVIVEHPIGNPIGIVVLGSSEKGRFEDVKKILEWIKNQ
ncbi:hypothetical protein A3G55_03190 [Candidatus Giovannonibacteria bacterium RIFCSPLOWO2_12_FULL_44_25]|uniref:Serine-type D-Ala-D-Ala carboxypeptidase n=3 Tax=Parcubacteria group TaxID=1794811 RepID=A0A837IGH2_9BACT|nr:MAG: D-alanyl-D-alanine carboxypeptidase, D-alanyl-D-alanine carboxypeptidase [Parcubacteria group bacterium GW2011_GWC1_44_10]KKT60026.1 MAG: Serine-type D-Ala-D-Ala carboxypeptidase [Candidatus Giovannonibacteria bacterium GW2011_GWA1_44_25]KKU12056.1 MAG: Serine-type D-Ala-D-Ala carboxypeptidase [Candidatus Azambacteria bacterium GW2011_GWC2_45_7b]KKU30144.1 MAG: Serine-type D-Ala-D-Ala carboxypeptidase [Candidatus Giovannonibacteria bacterium GW2011_GWB1_46_20]OGF49729.1 MAG: hypothetica